MSKHFRYLKYLIRHKYFVYVAGRKLGVGRIQLLIHDWHKFLPSEWFAYAHYFYGGPHQPWAEIPSYAKWEFFFSARWFCLEEVEKRFDVAWLKHQHRAPHHWQHWVLREDSGATKLLLIPDKYRLEMIADWMGAGRAIHGSWDGTAKWYEANRENIQLHPDTRFIVERQLGLIQTTASHP